MVKKSKRLLTRGLLSRIISAAQTPGTGITAAVTLCLLCSHASAEVIATVDRTTVELNESFALKLSVDSQIDVEPNFDVLAVDFHLGVPSSRTNTTMINGDISRSRSWSLPLMAKRAGEIVIPPIRVGAEQSNPVVIRVTPQLTAAPGEADIFITAEVDNDNSYVQAQVLYTVKTYSAVATRQPRWSEPTAAGVEALVEIAGEQKDYEALLNGRSYHVTERAYAFFPQESGELQIPPASFQARVLRDGRITGRKVFQSDPITVVVNPIPPPPDEFPDAAWFPAKSVELTQDWSRDLLDLPAGEPITRHVTIIVSGQLQTQIPVLEPASAPGIRVYPDKPEERTVAGAGGIRAMRRDQYAIIGTQPGTVELPEVILPWWNVDEAEWQKARLPAATLTIMPSASALLVPPPQSEPAAADTPAQTVVVESRVWRTVSEGLLALWFLTLILWWWSRREKTPVEREAKPVPLHKQQAKFLKTARKAALSSDTAELKRALLDWGRLQWPHDAPRNIGDLAKRVSMPLSIELNKMCSASYGPGPDSDSAGWDGDAVAKALRSFSVLTDDDFGGTRKDLPTLFPNPPAYSRTT